MKARHVPLRTCVVCKEKKPKRDLLRIVRTPDGEVVLDSTGRANGRGSYVCGDAGHWGDPALRAKLGYALTVRLDDADVERLSQSAGAREKVVSTKQDDI
ncbi:MAG: YlxR family protein [Chloroflexi bacterium]|nr:YlxR family protein [Chloroflexota bacterium]